MGIRKASRQDQDNRHYQTEEGDKADTGQDQHAVEFDMAESSPAQGRHRCLDEHDTNNTHRYPVFYRACSLAYGVSGCRKIFSVQLVVRNSSGKGRNSKLRMRSTTTIRNSILANLTPAGAEHWLDRNCSRHSAAEGRDQEGH